MPHPTPSQVGSNLPYSFPSPAPKERYTGDSSCPHLSPEPTWPDRHRTCPNPQSDRYGTRPALLCWKDQAGRTRERTSQEGGPILLPHVGLVWNDQQV